MDEGELLLRHQLHGNYYSVLRAIADHGPCSYAELRGMLPRIASIGPYLTSPVQDFALVEKEMSVLSNHGSRNARYAVVDQFLLSWMKAICPAVKEARHGY